MDQLDDLLKRAESGNLQEKDVELIKGMAECISVLSQAVDEKAFSVKKLLRMVFGATTEKKWNRIQAWVMPFTTCSIIGNNWLHF